MARPLLRKARIAPSLELLEDRRMLSVAGPPSWLDDSAFASPDHAELAPAAIGPMSGAGDSAWTTLDRGDQTDTAEEPTSSSTSGTGSSSPDIPDRAVSEPGTDRVPSSATAPTTCAPSDQGFDYSDLASAPTSTTASSPLTPSVQVTASSASVSAQSDESASPALAVGSDLAASIVRSEATSAYAPSDARNSVVDPPTESSNLAVPFATSLVTSAHAVSSAQSPRAASTSSGTWVETDSEDSSVVASPESPGGGQLATTGVGDSAGGLARGTTSFGVGNGSGSLAPLWRPAPDPDPSKGPAEGRPIALAPGDPAGEPGLAEDQGGASDLAQRPADQATEPLNPRLADLILDLIPSGRPTLDAIVDRLFDPIDDLSVSLTRWDASIILLASSLTVAGAALTLELSLRRRRSREVDEDLDNFPGLPGLGTGAL